MPADLISILQISSVAPNPRDGGLARGLANMLDVIAYLLWFQVMLSMPDVGPVNGEVDAAVQLMIIRKLLQLLAGVASFLRRC